MKIVGIKYLRAVEKKLTGSTGRPKPAHKKQVVRQAVKRSEPVRRWKPEDKLKALIHYRNSQS